MKDKNAEEETNSKIKIFIKINMIYKWNVVAMNNNENEEKEEVDKDDVGFDEYEQNLDDEEKEIMEKKSETPEKISFSSKHIK